MDNAIFGQIKEILAKDESIGILIGKDANLDNMGAALSLYLLLQQVNKKVSIATPLDPLVEISSLIGINKVKKSLDTGESGDLVVSFPYEEGEIEKVSYTLEQGYLNILVKAGELGFSFSQDDVMFKRGGGLPKTIFIIGTPRLSDLGNLFDPEALKGATLINVDNKADNQAFGDIVFVSPDFSSVCEQMARILTFLGFEIDIDVAQNLLNGLSFATDNFSNFKTSPFAFELCATLLRKGAVRPKSLPEEKPLQKKVQDWAQPMPKKNFLDDLKSTGLKTIKQTPPTSIKRRNAVEEDTTEEEETPPDWLAPKIYKGSTSIE
ncbi:MAG: hypothetical protein ABH816_00910 [Candidatus Levyibacteriota bacterium]